jgi:hypothetical protein
LGKPGAELRRTAIEARDTICAGQDRAHEGRRLVRKLSDIVRGGEEGHAGPLPGMVAAAAGAIILGIGAAADTGWLSIVGGIVLAVGILAAFVMNHMMVEYGIYERLESIEKK